MSDQPYSFGPTDPRESATPDGHSRSAPPSGSEPAPWGAKPGAEGRKRMSTVTKSLTAVGVAALIAVGGTVAVTSANADNATSSAPSGMQPVAGGEGAGSVGGSGPAATGAGGTGTDGTGTAGTGTGRAGGFGGGMASRSLVAGALHGEFVVADGTGTVTERLQTGSVTAVSSTSLTVKSTDGFTAGYTIPSGTDVSALTTGTTVTVIAKVDGSTLTVISIAATPTSTGGTGTGGFTPPDGAIPGGGGTGSSGSGTGTGGSGSTGTAPGSTGTDGTGTAPGGNTQGGSTQGGSTTGTTGEGSGV